MELTKRDTQMAKGMAVLGMVMLRIIYQYLLHPGFVYLCLDIRQDIITILIQGIFKILQYRE